MPLPVSQDFHEKMKLQTRRIYGKIQVDYTDPFIDQSIQVFTSENANYSYPEQVSDNIEEPHGKIASLDGSWVLDGTYVLAPTPEEAEELQMGWWGSQLSDENGNYTAPYPTLAVTFAPRPIRSLQVIADNKRKEWPVNFEINLYSNDTLLYTENVTDNTEIFWSTDIERVNEVMKMELIITKWSHANRQVKVLEFFTSIQETYETDDILLINLLEEREVSQGSLPVGNISSNEIDIRLVNEDGKFDAGNRDSPLYQLLKQNRRIKAWLGTHIDYDIVPTKFLVDTDAEWNQGVLTDVVAVDGGLELENNPYLSFDGVNDQVRIENSVELQLVDNFKIKILLKITDLEQREKYFIQKNNKYALIWGYENNTIEFYTNDYVGDNPRIGSQITITDTDWHKVEYIYDGATFVGKLDDVEVFSLNKTFALGIDASDLTFGSANVSNYLNGCLDDIEIYKNGTLSAHYKMNEGTGTTLTDSAGNNNGTIYGATWINNYKPTGQRTQQYNLSHISSIKDSVISWNTLYPFSYENDDSFTNLKREYVFDTELYLSAGEYQCTFDAYDEESGMEMGLKLENAQHTINVYATTAGGNNLWTSQKETFIVPEDGYYTIKGVNFQSYSYTWGIRNIKITGTTIENISNTSTIIIETNLSLDNGQTWLGWKECTNGGSIPDITAGMDLSNAILDTRQTLSTNDTTVTPRLEQLKITINGIEYFPEPELKYIPLGTFWSGDWTAPEGEIYAQTTGRDRLELLSQSTYSNSQVRQNVTLYELAIDVLEDYGLESEDYFVDEELRNTVIPYAYFTSQSHREALRKIAEASLGQCYCDRDGLIRLEDYSYLQSKTEPDITITRDDYFKKDNPYNYMQIANYIEVETQPLRPAPVEEVYRSNEPVSINAGETISITAYYNNEPCIEPVASVEGTGTISEVTYYSWGADVKVTSNTTGEFELVINAKPLRVQGAEKVVAKDDDSIRENGMIKYTFPKNSLVQTRQQAQKIADNLLAYFKDPRRDLTAEWRGNPAVLLGDRVRIVDEYGGEDFFITKQNIEYDGGLRVQMEGRKVE